MLARAILQKPAILILDEATSSLDNINEKNIDKHLNEMNCTRIIVAHRLYADCIIVLNDGKIVESGTQYELMKKKGFYYNLYYSKSNNEELDAVLEGEI